MGIKDYMAAILKGRTPLEIKKSISREDMDRLATMMLAGSVVPRRIRRKAQRDIARKKK